jgi:hypothetical protein
VAQCCQTSHSSITVPVSFCLQDVDPEVYSHLARLGPSPLDLAFPWIMSAFVGHLSPSETLLLWDRIIGFDSLLPLPVLAAAVMTFRWASGWGANAPIAATSVNVKVTAALTAQSSLHVLVTGRLLLAKHADPANRTGMESRMVGHIAHPTCVLTTSSTLSTPQHALPI